MRVGNQLRPPEFGSKSDRPVGPQEMYGVAYEESIRHPDPYFEPHLGSSEPNMVTTSFRVIKEFKTPAAFEAWVIDANKRQKKFDAFLLTPLQVGVEVTIKVTVK